MVATTLNINTSVLSQISECAASIGKARREIIVVLLKRLMEDLDSFRHSFKTVTYQDDDEKENWRCFHINFRDDDYEYFVDLRKLCKFSVSCLLAIAVKKYLKKLMYDTENDLIDNYRPFVNYVLHKKEIESIIYYGFYWGIPKEHLKTIIP